MEESICLESTTVEECIVIKISELSPLMCNRSRLIEASDYFEALILRGNFKEGVLGCVDFSISQ